MNQCLFCEEYKQTIKGLEQKINRIENTESQCRYLVDSTTDSVYLVDDQCRYLFINQNHLQRLNISADQIIGHFYGDFHSLPQSREFAERVKQVFSTGRSLQDEHQSPQKTNYFLRTFSPVAKGNNIIAVAVISKDITKRRQVEEALQKSEEKYRLLIENSNEAIFIIQDNLIMFANKRFYQMLGYDAAELSSL
ncbi:MAG TPA: PAS domain-containing protein, partial [Smithellaceae bacterium]|nr:PAS domain-containing protein [Smithellaceae bacterium]